jgi:hypothetical protein
MSEVSVVNTGARWGRLWPFVAVWGLLVGGLAHALFVREYGLAQFEVPCRATDGRVWAYQVSPHGDWVASHEIGEESLRQSRIAEAPNSLNCNPSTVTRPDLDQLENGVVESVALTEDDGTWSFVLRDEMRGIFTYRYRFLDGHVAPIGATRRLINLPAYGTFWVLVFGGLAVIIRRSVARRARGSTDCGPIGSR